MIKKVEETPKFTVYCGTIAHTPRIGELEVKNDARVGVDRSGTIRYIYDHKTCLSAAQEAFEFDKSLNLKDIVIEVLDQKNTQFYFPGFFDTHIHAPQYPNCGVFGNSTLFDWLSIYTYPIEMKLADTAKAKEVYEKVVQRTLFNGTTCCSYYATIHVDSTNVLAETAKSFGQRAFIGRSCMDCGRKEYSDNGFEDGKDATLKVIDFVKKIDPEFSLIRPIISPRNANKCSREFMIWLATISKHRGLPIQAHMSETEEEVEQILKQFPECSTYADIYDSHNLLTERTILGHCVHVTDEELQLIEARGSSISHCPTSNSCLTSGEAKIKHILERGINVGLGSDISGGYSPSILSTARHAILVSRHVSMRTKREADKLSVNEALYLATMGGAQSCCLERELGTFEVGKKWECQLISLDEANSPIDIFKWEDETESNTFQNNIDRWVFNGDDRNVRKVYVSGRCVVDKSTHI